VNADAACPNLERTVSVAPPGPVVGQVAVLQHPYSAVDLHGVAHLFQGVDLGDHLGGHFRAGQKMVAEKILAGDINQRVIDLEVEELLDASGLGGGKDSAADQGR